MMDKKTENRIRTVLPLLNELQKRKYLAAEAESLGWGGISEVSKLTGVARNTIASGRKESEQETAATEGKERIRKKGGGRKDIEEKQPGITEALLKLVDGYSFGNPGNPLQWTTKSLRNLSEELCKQGYQISHVKVGQLLENNGFSLQVNRKMMQVGKQSPDRDEQFRHINETATKFMAEGQPVISIDCKKKENIGNFKNNGVEYAPKKEPVKVLDHDFPLPDKGKAVPYGVYDMGHNEGYVNVGIGSDTAQFAVHSILEWWNEMGKERYPNAQKIYITADGGGSNGSRNRLWKKELQRFADETSFVVEVSHFPPGTSKWNKIEHRLFSQISKNWRGRPLETLEVVVNLISSTTTKTGLIVKCGVDMTKYPSGIKVSDQELECVNLSPDSFHGEWNYVICPHS